MSDDAFVTIKHAASPVEAEMILDLLGSSGIVGTAPGTHHGALLGAAGALLQIAIQVPATQAEEARRLIAALDDYDEVFPDGDDGPSVPAGEMQRRLERADADEAALVGSGPYREGAIPTPAESPRLKRVAFFCAIALTFGCGHFYARSYRAGTVLLLVELAAILLAMTTDFAPALLGVLAAVAADVVGSLRACELHGGATTTGLLQRVREHAALGALASFLPIAALGLYRAAAPARYLATDIAELCAHDADCHGDEEGEGRCRRAIAGDLAEGRTSARGVEGCVAWIRDGRGCGDAPSGEHYCEYELP